MKTVSNTGRKAEEENPLEVCDGFYHENSRILLYEFGNYKAEPSHLPFKITLVLAWNFLQSNITRVLLIPL